MKKYAGLSGNNYALDQKLGEGGEGIVYAIKGDNSKVAKIYKPSHFKNASERETMNRKLRVMLKLGISPVVDGKLRLAWPQDILYESGEMVGFIMPCVDPKYKIFDMYRGDRPNCKRERAYPDYTWKHSVQFAYLLAWVVDYVHRYNIIIGDMNQQNIVVDTVNSTVILIDCDSFDITDPDTKEHFPCTVGFQEMLAPELQNCVKLKNATFSKESDNFSLAIHIFRLLMENADPFGGIVTSGLGGSVSIGQVPANHAIINGECPYVRSVGKKIPDGLPGLEILPPEIQQLFHKTFYYDAITVFQRINNRARAEEWRDALFPLTRPEPNPAVKLCGNNTHGGPHIYPSHNSNCPWCECERYRASLLQVPGKSVISKVNAAKAYGPGNIRPRRTPYLFYTVMILFGISSGFVFMNPVNLVFYQLFEESLDGITCALILSAVGIIFGIVSAHYFQNKYVYADNAIPWLFLSLVVLIAPPIIVLIIGMILLVILAIIAGIVSIIGTILLIFFIIACASGS